MCAAVAFLLRDYFVDDAFIGFQYLKNLLAGNGFVFLAGDRPVEGVTNIGWLLAIAPAAALVGPALAAKLAGCVLLAASLLLTAALGRTLRVRGSLVAPLLLASSFEFVYFSLAGMETALLATVLLAMAWIALRRPYSTALPVLGVLAFLIHPEAAAVYPLYAAITYLRVTGEDARAETKTLDGRRLLLGIAVLAALVGAITAARFAYFGDVVPNTFHSKPSGFDAMVQNGFSFLMGQNTNVGFPITGWLAIPVLAWGWLRLRQADMLAAVCAVGLAFAVYSPTDWTAMPRYFAPYLPAALLLLWAGTTKITSRLFVLPATDRLATFFLAVVLLATNVVASWNKIAELDRFPGYVLAGKTLVGPASWMRDHLPAQATIATRRIGALAYYSGHRVFDYAYGLPDATISRRVACRGSRFDTPTDPALAAPWRERLPEYLLEDEPILDAIIAESGGSRERFVIHGVAYRVVRRFPIGRDVPWVLAERL